jgi:hypothetical protein
LLGWTTHLFLFLSRLLLKRVSVVSGGDGGADSGCQKKSVVEVLDPGLTYTPISTLTGVRTWCAREGHDVTKSRADSGP